MQAEYWLSSPDCQTEYSRRSEPVLLQPRYRRFRIDHLRVVRESYAFGTCSFARSDLEVLCGVRMRARGASTLHHAKTYPNSNLGDLPFSMAK
jgi:hypothetical protein